MRREKRWRYYCDHCKKSSGSGGHMSRHERGCTLNPKRECGHCYQAELVQEPMRRLLSALGKGDKKGMADLREVAEGCPACMLAAIRQSDIMENGEEDKWGAITLHCDAALGFNFKKEAEQFWSELNSLQADYEMRSVYS